MIINHRSRVAIIRLWLERPTPSSDTIASRLRVPLDTVRRVLRTAGAPDQQAVTEHLRMLEREGGGDQPADDTPHRWVALVEAGRASDNNATRRLAERVTSTIATLEERLTAERDREQQKAAAAAKRAEIDARIKQLQRERDAEIKRLQRERAKLAGTLQPADHNRQEAEQIRAWCAETGRTVASRGKIPARLRMEWREHQSTVRQVG